MAHVKDLAGMVFGSLTVEKLIGRNKHGLAVWQCLCSCGRTHEATGSLLTRGHVTSCGNHGHGMRGTLIYGVWNSMKNRCSNPKVKSYPSYGGRGIKVCDRWQKFENFFADMGDRPSPSHSLERRDNNGDYSPENCQWAIHSVQAKNKRNNRFITANGESLHLAEWARRLGCNPAAILARLAAGMPESEAVTKTIPDRPNSRLAPAEAIAIRATYPNLSAQKLADLYGVSKKTILNVIHGKTFADLH